MEIKIKKEVKYEGTDGWRDTNLSDGEFDRAARDQFRLADGLRQVELTYSEGGMFRYTRIMESPYEVEVLVTVKATDAKAATAMVQEAVNRLNVGNAEVSPAVPA